MLFQMGRRQGKTRGTFKGARVFNNYKGTVLLIDARPSMTKYQAANYLRIPSRASMSKYFCGSCRFK